MRPVTLALLIAIVAVCAAGQLLPFEKPGIEAMQQKDFKRCAELLSDAVRTGPKQAVRPAAVAARCYAEIGNTGEARRYLDIALSRGYRSCKSLATAPVWAPLRESAQWPQVTARCQANEDRYYERLNPEVFASFIEDQGDRAAEGTDLTKALEHDRNHRRIVSMAMARHGLKTTDDYYHAAMIMQHGTTTDDYALARRLAERAAALDPSNAPAVWLVAAATDRYLMKSGAPQVYGTQLSKVDGRWTLEPFDPAGVTDAERQRHAVAMVAERLKEVEKLNQP